MQVVMSHAVADGTYRLQLRPARQMSELGKVTAFVVTAEKPHDLLVFKHPTAGLQLPAGTIEPGESPIAAAKREVWEETGRSGWCRTSAGCDPVCMQYKWTEHATHRLPSSCPPTTAPASCGAPFKAFSRKPSSDGNSSLDDLTKLRAPGGSRGNV